MENLWSWANWHRLFVIFYHARKIHEFEIANKNATNLKRNYIFNFPLTELGLTHTHLSVVYT
jgi:hypothetical protein